MVELAASSGRRLAVGRLVRPAGLLAGLLGLLGAALLVGVGVGAVRIAPADSIAIVLHHLGIGSAAGVEAQDDAILWIIRLPRVLLGALVGAALGVTGAALQGIFRNPLADPGLIGVSAGASLGAVAAIVLGITAALPAGLQLSAFVGGLVATLVVYALARYEGRTETVTLVLTGVAVTAITGAAIGLLIARADDAQLRDIVFWSMGSLGGATWNVVAATAPCVAIGVAVACSRARELDLMTLGEREAGHLGVNTERTRFVLVLVLALATGAAVAAAGVIAFVGLVVPHLVRLAAGPAHSIVLPGSALAGAALVVLADVVARTAAAPVELPLGVITSLAGGPFFLWLLWRTRRAHGGWG
jgi:iron complex transport system permease protein